MRSPKELEREITERKPAEEAFHLASARLDLAVRGSNIGIWEIDMPEGVAQGGRVEFLNVLEQLGYDRPDGPADVATRMTLVHPDDRDRVEQAIQAYLDDTIREFEVEHRSRHKDGSYRWMLTRGVAMRDAAGRPIRLIGSSIDMTDHRRAEEALRESEARFRGTFENAAVGIAHKGADGRWLRVNEKYCAIVGYSREELLAWTFQDITHPEDLGAELEQYARLKRGELASYSLEKRHRRKDGSLVWIDLCIALQRNAAGEPAYAIAILQDISERKRLEGELRQAKEAAESANRAKDEFLAKVSHEIRTPVNAILGMTDLALDTPLTDDLREYLTTVKSAGDNLLGVINDLLDFARIEAGKLELDPADFSLRASLGDTLRALAVRAHTKGLELVCHMQPDVPDALVGDAGRLRQVLLNLVGNAIKFTERGEVVVTVATGGPPHKPEAPATGLPLAGASGLCDEPTGGPPVATGGRPHARDGRPGVGRPDPATGRAVGHPHHPADRGGPPRQPGPGPGAAPRRPSAQAGPAGRVAPDDLPGDEPARRRCRAGAGTRGNAGPGRGAAARPGGRGQRVQRAPPGTGAGPAGPQRPAGDRRPRGAGPGGRRGVRRAAPGLAHAGARRLPGHRGDPGAGAGRGETFARHRPDGALAEGRPRALPRGRHGRLPLEADPGCGTVRGHRPGGIRPRRRPPAGCRGRQEPARPGRPAGRLRR
jgi:PAS domain S-box-containing protein